MKRTDGADARTHNARRDVSRTARTRARVKDLDQIQEDMKPENKEKYAVQPLDEDKPGLGQHVSSGLRDGYSSGADESTVSTVQSERAGAGLGGGNGKLMVDIAKLLLLSRPTSKAKFTSESPFV